MTYTQLLHLVKLDLSDSPPDITVLNQNWDTLDEFLSGIESTVQEAGGGFIKYTGPFPNNPRPQTLFFEAFNDFGGGN